MPTIENKIPTTIENVYEKYVNLVFRFVYSRTRNRHISEDITSEVFLKIVRYWDKYNHQKAGIGTWIFTITQNTLIDYFRKNNKQKLTQPIDEEAEQQCNKTHDDYVQIDIDTARILKAVAKLNKIEQLLIFLRFTQEMSYNEIAQETGMNINTVGVKLQRTIYKLQKILDVK